MTTCCASAFLISCDLAADRATGLYGEIVAEEIKRFQMRHGLAATGMATSRTLAAPNANHPLTAHLAQ